MELLAKRIKLEVKKKKLLVSITWALIGIAMPHILSHENFYIIEGINRSIEMGDKGILITSAFKMVSLNSIRAFPNYISAFTLIDSLKIFWSGKRCRGIEIIVGLLIIPLIYFFIYEVYGIRYYFGKLTTISLLYLGFYAQFKFTSVNIFKRMMVFLLFVIGIQWLDITTFPLRVGIKSIGEISYDIRLAANFIDGSKTLDLVGIIFFSVFLTFSFLLLTIFMDNEKMLKISKDNEKMNSELSEMRLKELENRYLKEVQYLVHDIKTPLFSIKTLVEILELQEGDERKQEYYKRIERAIEKCDVMISEILKSTDKNWVTTGELFRFILACLSTHECIKYIKYNNNIKDRKININKIFFSRAIINLIINAFEAVKDTVPMVEISVEDNGIETIIRVEDNGEGIEEKLEKVFSSGYSTKGSSGIGLNFVKKVMDDHRCHFEIIKGKDLGSIVTIKIKGGEGQDEKNIDNR